MDAKTLNDLGQPSYRERRYYEAGREQGMREAAAIAMEARFGTWFCAADDVVPTVRGMIRAAILSAIGEGG